MTTPEMYAEGSLPEYAHVPVVWYDKDGSRKIIGEAVVRSREVTASVGDEAAKEIMDMLLGPNFLSQLSIDMRPIHENPNQPKLDLYSLLSEEK